MGKHLRRDLVTFKQPGGIIAKESFHNAGAFPEYSMNNCYFFSVQITTNKCVEGQSVNVPLLCKTTIKHLRATGRRHYTLLSFMLL